MTKGGDAAMSYSAFRNLTTEEILTELMIRIRQGDDDVALRDPAFIVVSADRSWNVQGPRGLVWSKHPSKFDADNECTILNRAFYAGVQHAERRHHASGVPGPPDAPRPINPNEVG